MTGRRPQPAVPQVLREVTALTVRVGDTLVVDDVFRKVKDVIARPGGDRLILFVDGGAHRLRLKHALPRAVPPPKPKRAPTSWRAQPDTTTGADQVVHVMQCTVCHKKSPGCRVPEAAHRWAEGHTGRLPTHRRFREIVHRPWYTTPES